MKALNIRRCLLYVSAFLYVLAANADTHNLTFNLSDFQIEQNDSVVSITPVKPGYSFGLDTSTPALPLYTQRISIDGKSKKGTFTYEVRRKELIASNVYVAPNEECYATNMPIPAVDKIAPPDYGQQIYPEITADFIYGTTMRDGKEISFLTVSPFEYDAANGNLYFISSISLSFEKEPRAPSRQATTRANNEVVKYIVITADSLVDAFKPLRDWKTQKGVKAEIISTEAIYAQYAGADNQEKIKRCLFDYFENHSLDWVLLGGDNFVVPSRNCYIYNTMGEAYNTTVASDAYYANFEGEFDWNADDDKYYGEIEDNVFLTPQIKVSRLPVCNTVEVKAYTQKLLNYEKAFYAGAWMNRMLLSGCLLNEYHSPGVSDAHFSTETMYEDYIRPLYPNLEKHYFYDTGNNLGYTGNDSILNSSNLIRAFNSIEPHYMHMNTHGMPDYWQLASTDFYASDVLQLTNDNKPMIITSEACYSGYFQSYGSPKLCEAFLKKERGGALAFWGSSFKGFTSISEGLCRDFWVNLNDSYHRFADAVIAAKSMHAGHFNTYDHARTLILAMNAIGDPDLTVYTSANSYPHEHINMKFYPDSVFVQGLQTDIITMTSLGDNGATYYRTGEYYGEGSPNVPVLVCVDRSKIPNKYANDYFLLTVKSGRNIFENENNTLYLQGQTFPGGKISYTSDVIIVGNNVDSTQTQGNVVVKQGTLAFDSSVKTVIKNGFKCEKGARLIIK
ncbi:MAG: hypothetical protein E7091_10560 [Bacteroidales bacterium]|nr:hypothetical protein [Bacteroidales bacterium]